MVERITEIDSDLQMRFKEIILNFASLSRAIDKSTNITDVAQLAVSYKVSLINL